MRNRDLFLDGLEHLVREVGQELRSRFLLPEIISGSVTGIALANSPHSEYIIPFAAFLGGAFAFFRAVETVMGKIPPKLGDLYHNASLELYEDVEKGRFPHYNPHNEEERESYVRMWREKLHQRVQRKRREMILTGVASSFFTYTFATSLFYALFR